MRKQTTLSGRPGNVNGGPISGGLALNLCAYDFVSQKFINEEFSRCLRIS